MAFKKKSVKVEEVKEVAVEEVVWCDNCDCSLKEKFEAQLDRLQLNLISTEERRMFTKQEIMAIVESILR